MSALVQVLLTAATLATYVFMGTFTAYFVGHRTEADEISCVIAGCAWPVVVPFYLLVFLPIKGGTNAFKALEARRQRQSLPRAKVVG